MKNMKLGDIIKHTHDSTGEESPAIITHIGEDCFTAMVFSGGPDGTGSIELVTSGSLPAERTKLLAKTKK